MNIYIDFDDCLCETARYFSSLVKEMYGRNVPYENIDFFDLEKSFSLSREQFEEMMIEGHRKESLLSYEETPGAISTVNAWVDSGYNVSIITGRPSSAFEASREWLDIHGLSRVQLYCLNKYGRDSFIKNSDFNLEIEDYYKMHFDYAIEDSPYAFSFFEHLPNLKVMVYDRPWNHKCDFPGDNYCRCYDWEMIRKCMQRQNKESSRRADFTYLLIAFQMLLFRLVSLFRISRNFPYFHIKLKNWRTNGVTLA